MHDIGRGRFNYMGDFIASMNKGPVKVDFGKDAKPISEKQKAIDELNERNLKMIQRSLTLGSGLAVIACFVGWQFTKWWYGVRDIHGFGEKMSERMPKVSGKLEDSALGRKLQATSEASRDAISEDKNLTDWRRSLRGKFNTSEGAALARQNSLVLAQRREAERIARKSKKAAVSSTSEVPEGTISADMALAAAAAASEEAAAPAPKARLTRKNSMDLATMAAAEAITASEEAVQAEAKALEAVAAAEAAALKAKAALATAEASTAVAIEEAEAGEKVAAAA